MFKTAGAVFVVLVLLTGCGGADAPAASPAASQTSVKVRSDLAVILGADEAVPAAKALPETAVLGGPNFTTRLAEVGTATRIEQSTVTKLARGMAGLPSDAKGPIEAGTGNEFLFVKLAPIPGMPKTMQGITQSRLRIGGEARTLEGLVGQEGVILALVPVGAPVILIVRDADRDQSIDLRTGAVGADAVTAYTRPRPFDEVTFEVRAQLAGEPYPTRIEVEMSAALEPYDHRFQGTWAAPGRTWLRVWLDVKLSSIGTFAGELDVAKSLQIKADGRTVALRPSTAKFQRSQTTIIDYTTSAADQVDVAEGSVTSLTIRFEPKGTFTRDGRPAAFSVSASPQQTIKLA